MVMGQDGNGKGGGNGTGCEWAGMRMGRDENGTGWKWDRT